MTQLYYRLLNVFTRDGGTLTGNPLCVFEHGEQLNDQTMQALARQFNLSETTFLLPATAPGAHARVRIFTPSYEMPFAGHPTLGSAHVCRALGRGGDQLRLEMRAGVICVSAHGGRWTLVANTASHREVEVPRARLALLLGLRSEDIAERPLWVKSGKEQLIVPLRDAEAVRRAMPRPDAFNELISEDGTGMAFVFAQTAPGNVLSRFFFPDGIAITEDPATGSATANLGGWWLAMQRALPCSLVASQGERVGRPSTLFLDVEVSGEIRVGGEVLELGRGYVNL